MKKAYVIGTVLIAVLIIGVCVYLSIKDRYAYEEFNYSTPLRERDSDENSSFEKKDGEAYIISNIVTSNKVCALTFDNVPSIEIANQIMDILDKHSFKGTFFIRGSRIYEEPELPGIITGRGHYVGNSALMENSSFDKLSIDDMIREFLLTNDLIEESSGFIPIYFRIDGEYSSDVLSAAYSANLKAAVPYDIRIDGNTIKDAEKADKFVRYTKRGSVISVDASKTENLLNMINILSESAKNKGLNFISIKELEKLNNPNSIENYNFDDGDGRKSDILRRVNSAENIAALTFDGIGDDAFVTEILNALDEKKIKALFFVSGDEVEKKTEIIKEIIKRGHEIGSNLMSGANIDSMSFDDTYAEVKEANEMFKSKIGFIPEYIRPKNGKTNKFISDIAKHTKQIAMTYSNNPLDKNMISASQISELVVGKIRKGDIIILNGDTNKEVSKAVALINDGLNKKGFKLVSFKELYNSPKYIEGTVKISKPETVKANFDKASVKEAEIKEQTVVEPDVSYSRDVFSYARTTAKKVALTFDGIGDDEMVNNILSSLEKSNIKATFFIPTSKINDNKELILKIKNKGHEIGLNTSSKAGADNADYSTAYNDVKKGSDELKSIIGADIEYVRPAFGKYADKLLKASYVLGKKVVTYSKNPLDRRMINADQIMEYIEKKITRGEIILLNADTNPAVIEAIPRIADFVRDIGYDFTTISDLYKGQYEVKSFEEIPNHDAIKINYYLPDTPPRFIEKIPNNENKVFITFDDWGGDKVITKILDVLEEKNVKATFFLRAAGVENNVNLAKAISEGGHDVASHTYSHTDIIELSKEALQEDLYKAHKVITEAIQRCPELFMRPPRLYKDDEHMRAVKAMGYRAIMSADVSSHDWEEGLSAESIKNDILSRTENGTVIILHMLDDAKGYEIVGDLIDKLRAKGFSFAKISDYIGN